mmetsp:Transcript_22015/g.51845  ORF Transcript_22015/g.51845 Transcript_22015/m.51845 type:complete len:615 (+) Transcript_22015:121-1965(+)
MKPTTLHGKLRRRRQPKKDGGVSNEDHTKAEGQDGGNNNPLSSPTSTFAFFKPPSWWLSGPLSASSSRASSSSSTSPSSSSSSSSPSPSTAGSPPTGKAEKNIVSKILGLKPPPISADDDHDDDQGEDEPVLFDGHIGATATAGNVIDGPKSGRNRKSTVSFSLSPPSSSQPPTSSLSSSVQSTGASRNTSITIADLMASQARSPPETFLSRTSSRFGRSIRSIGDRSSAMITDTTSEMTRLVRHVSVKTLLGEEIQRATNRNRRVLMFPEAPDLWDVFWISLLVVFVLSVLPGTFAYVWSRLPSSLPYWVTTGDTVHFYDVNSTMALYHSPHFNILTPLSKPMPNYFFVHIVFGAVASCLLIFLFTTGRVMRWRLADGTVDYDSADDLHKLSALFSSIFWVIIIGTGASAIPLLHPTLQIANYAELFGVVALFVGTLLSAYFRQWILHRLCVWGLIYSATASVFLLVNGRLLQAYSGLPCFQVKAINYVLAFSIPIVGLGRDVFGELKKMNTDDDKMELKLQQVAEEHNLQLHRSSNFQFGTNQAFKATRGDRGRKISFWQHVTQSEDLSEYETRRHSSVMTDRRPNEMKTAVMEALLEDSDYFNSFNERDNS